MPKEKAPAFQFYPKDFLSDERVLAMTHTERGIYITFLCVCWLEGSLPADVAGLARVAGMTSGRFAKVWEGPLGRCFQPATDGRLTHKRLEAEREKQSKFRRRQSDAAASRWHSQPDANTQAMPRVCSPISYLQSSSSKKEPDARSKRPIFDGQRLTVFEWMLDDCMKTLGTHTDSFDLHSWFFDVDAAAVRDGLVIPKKDGGAWLQARLVEEAKKRGLPLKFATMAKPSDDDIWAAVAAAGPSKR